MIRLRQPKPQIHRVPLCYPRSVLPGAVIRHSPSETYRGGRAGAFEGGIKQSLDSLGGFSDLIVLWHGRFGAFEVKAGKNDATEDQESVGAQIIAMGGRWAVVRSVEQTADLVYVSGEGTPSGR